MVLDIQGKQCVVSKINKVMETALSVIVASLEGMRVNEVTVLRNLCRKNNVLIYVVRNTLMRRVLKDSVFACLRDVFAGSNIIAFSTVDAIDCLKVFVQFSKENKKFKIKGSVFDGKLIEGSKVAWLSSLPSYSDCIVDLMCVMKEISLGRLVRVLHMLSRFKERTVL